MKKLLLISMMLSAMIPFGSAKADMAEWIAKVPNHIRWARGYSGKHVGGGYCSVSINPSDKDGMIVDMKKTHLIDPMGNRDKDLADMTVLPTDAVTGTQDYAAPFESDTVLAFGYAESKTNRKAIVLENMGSNKVSVTIEMTVDGELSTETCVVKLDR